jgi:hypothetical protein
MSIGSYGEKHLHDVDGVQETGHGIVLRSDANLCSRRHALHALNKDLVHGKQHIRDGHEVLLLAHQQRTCRGQKYPLRNLRREVCLAEYLLQQIRVDAAIQHDGDVCTLQVRSSLSTPEVRYPNNPGDHGAARTSPRISSLPQAQFCV